MWHQPAAQFEMRVLKLFRESGNKATTLQAIKPLPNKRPPL
jgi:hypothetical protein